MRVTAVVPCQFQESRWIEISWKSVGKLEKWKVGDEMSSSEELVALVALLRYGSFQRSQMPLRQRLIEGDLPSQILAEESEIDRIYERATCDVNKWISAGERPLSWLDIDYPQQLREVHDFPPVIFIRGQLIEMDQGICVVGSRDAGQAAIEAARQISERIVNAGWTVVGGLAKGIDTAAHAEALNHDGRTVAVIGNGIDYYYPIENRQLQNAIKDHGMVLSQFWPGASPTKVSFPMRNAVMSAYANATIIVSAKEKSGTRHQAKQAVAHGRPLIVSKAVYENTTWGKAFVDDPSVLARVAYSVEDSVKHAMEMAQFAVSDLLSFCR